MKLSKKGSIYWLATFDNHYIANKTDICTIAKRAFIGLLLTMMFVILVVLAILVIGLIPFHIFMYIITGVFLMTEPLSALLIVLFIITLTATIYYSFSLLNKARKGVVHKVETWEFTKTVYKSIKEKTCFLVEVE